MSLMIEMKDTRLEGVSHDWSPETERCDAYGILRFGTSARGVIVYFHKPAEIDEVIAELVALRAEMDPPPAGEGGILFEVSDDEAANPPHHVTSDDEQMCNAPGNRDSGYICTAQDGHDGPDHIAYMGDDSAHHRWPVAGPYERERAEGDADLAAVSRYCPATTDMEDFGATIYCDREAGHPGSHHAPGPDKGSEVAWSDEPAQVSA